MKVTHTILQNILVVAVGRELKKDTDDAGNKNKDTETLVLTLALDPMEVQTMALAQAESQGEISVVVRPRGDKQVNQIPVVTPGTLLR